MNESGGVTGKVWLIEVWSVHLKVVVEFLELVV